MEFNTFNKGYSASKQFEHDGLYVSFGCCCRYGDDSAMAIVSIASPELYVVGGEVFRAKLNDILYKESSPERKRELCEAEAYKLAARELKDIDKLKAFVKEIQNTAYCSGALAARGEIRRALGLEDI